MTLTSDTVKVQYSGDGATTSFAVSYDFWTTDDLEVVLTDSSGTETTWTRGTEYTVTGGSGSTGTVEVATSPTDYTPASGETLTIKSNLSKTQDTSLPAGGSFPSTSVEQQMDKIVRMLQEGAEALGRSIKFAVSSAFSGVSFPDLVAGKVLRVNTAGDGLELASATDGGSISLPLAVTDGGTAGTTAADARTNLGIDGASGNIATGDLADSAVTTAKIADANVTSDKVDASVWSTGDVKLTIKSAADTGWVLMDDGTIGDASSGGTTRANADTEDLFTLLWTNISDTYAPVSTGRGASAAADFAAHKTITLPAVLGRALAVSGAGSGLTSRALGETLGEEDHQLTEAEMPAHTHSYNFVSTGGAFQGGASFGNVSSTTGSTGGDGAHNTMQPTSFLNVMIKL